MTSDSGSRPTGRDVKQARGEARQSGAESASPGGNMTSPADAKVELVARARNVCANVFEAKADALEGAPLPNMAAVLIVRGQADEFRKGLRDDAEQMRIAITALEASADTPTEATDGFVPCPFCKQYSHSIGDDQLADAFMVFQSMWSHRNDGIPTQFCFDEKARDAAQVLMAAARSAGRK